MSEIIAKLELYELIDEGAHKQPTERYIFKGERTLGESLDFDYEKVDDLAKNADIAIQRYKEKICSRNKHKDEEGNSYVEYETEFYEGKSALLGAICTNCNKEVELPEPTNTKEEA